MKVKKYALKLIGVSLATTIVFSTLSTSSLASSSDIREELQEKLRNRDKLENSLNDLKNNQSKSKSKIDSLESDIKNIESKIDQNAIEEKDMKSQLEAIVGSKNSVANKIIALNSEIEKAIEKIYQLEADILDIENSIKETEKEIERLEKEVEINTKLLEERLYVMYKQGSVSTLEVLLTSSDINDFLSRQTMMGTITKYDKEIIAQLRSDKEKLDKLVIELNGQKVTLNITKDNTEKEKTNLENKKDEQNKLFNQLQKEENIKNSEIQAIKNLTGEYQKYLSQNLKDKENLEKNLSQTASEITALESSISNSLADIDSLKDKLSKAEEAERLARIKAQREAYERKQAELKRLAAEKAAREAAEKAAREAREAAEKKDAEKSKPSTPVTSKARLGWPAATYNITSYYGWRSNPFNGRGSEWHAGIDLAGGYGTAIYAAESGKVVATRWSSGYGNHIIISHGNGLQTLYAHLQGFSVSVGQSVSRGQYIAPMGSTGRSTGPHLHFEVILYGSTQNPLNYIR